MGRLLIETIAQDEGLVWEEIPEGAVTAAVIEGVAVELFKPRTAMNASGPMVQHLLESTGRHVDHCIVIHDDMDLASGDVRLKRDGGDAGHKGVRSIIGALGSGAFQRVRIGVRPGGESRRGKDLVLSDFSATDAEALPALLEQAKKVLAEAIRQKYNPKTSRQADLPSDRYPATPAAGHNGEPGASSEHVSPSQS